MPKVSTNCNRHIAVAKKPSDAPIVICFAHAFSFVSTIKAEMQITGKKSLKNSNIPFDRFNVLTASDLNKVKSKLFIPPIKTSAIAKTLITDDKRQNL